MEAKEEKQHSSEVEEVSPVNPSFLEYQGLIKSLLSIYPVGEEPVGDRMISLANGKMIFGIVLAETSDSFIVARPTILISEEDGSSVEGKLIASSPIVRFLKNSACFVAIPDVSHRCHYYKFLLKIKDRSPNLLEGNRLRAILEFLEKNDSITSHKKSKKHSSNHSDANKWVPPYISKAKH